MSNIFRLIFSKLKNHGSSLQQISFVVGGTFVAQVINIVILPVLSRIYSPADFGVIAVYSSMIFILSEVSGFRYHLAIPMPRQQRYAHALVYLSLIMQFVFVVIMSITLFFIGNYILDKVSMGDIAKYKLLIPIGVLGIGCYNILTQWSIREGFFSAIGKTRITQSVSGVLTKVVLGYLVAKPLGLLIGTIIGQAGGISTLLLAHFRKDGFPEFKINDIKKVCLKYRKFPLYNTWFGLINTLGGQIPVMMLSSFWGASETGLFTMASTLLSLPTTLIGQAIGQVFIQKASIARYSGDLPRLTLSVFVVLMQLGFFPIFFISFWGATLFSFFLGSRWGISGEYALALSPWLAIAFVYSPLSVLYVILERHEEAVFSEVFYLLLRILSLWVGAVFYSSALLSVLLFSAIGFIVLFIRIVHILKMAGNNIRNSLRKSIPIMIEAILFSGTPYLLYYNGVSICICVILVLIFIVLYLYRSYRLYEAEIIP